MHSSFKHTANNNVNMANLHHALEKNMRGHWIFFQTIIQILMQVENILFFILFFDLKLTGINMKYILCDISRYYYEITIKS